jgi:hypothetical protein
MVYSISKTAIMDIFKNEESVSFHIVKHHDSHYIVKLTSDTGLTRTFITDNIRDLFKK